MIDTLLSVDWTGIVLWICVVALILCGVAGTVVPALPGIPMIFLGALLAAWIGDFQHITWVPLVVLGVLTIIGLAVDWVAQTMGAQRAGASKCAARFTHRRQCRLGDLGRYDGGNRRQARSVFCHDRYHVFCALVLSRIIKSTTPL